MNLRIKATTAEEKPKYKATAAALLEACRAFYQDPKHEEEYRKWKAEREKRIR
ncbi:MAG: hypothetical protein J6U01_11945 [Clostridia bacterium]|jgi:hypothetical protein|nr:hypothetical protein [Clostridia bacterium]